MDLSDRPDTDPDLWVEVEGTAGRCYILGNPHTFPGRFVTWSDHLGNSLYVSKGEVTSCSDDARRWIEGFLNGNEPAIAEYLGIARIAADDLDDDDPGVERWRRALADFRSSGTIPLLKPVPRWPLPSAFVHGRRPWTWAGGQVWEWQAGTWLVADPQPPLDGTTIAGTVCARRGHCDHESVDDHHVACVDCGETTEVAISEGDASPDDRVFWRLTP